MILSSTSLSFTGFTPIIAAGMHPRSLARLESHLRARIGRRYTTVDVELPIGTLAIRFTRIREPDDVLDQIVAEEDRRERATGIRKSGDDLHLPYWAELWDSAMGLGQFLMRQNRTPGRVLDLGCGMGLGGTVAAALGCQVLLADLEAPSLLFARLNTLPFADRTRVRRVDWRTDRLDERFDLILGSDVLYERKQWDFLEPFWRNHLIPGGQVLLAEPGRQTGDLFPEWIGCRGWRLEEFGEPVSTRPNPIRIFRLDPAA